MRPINNLIMKIFIALLFLTLVFQSWTKADDIRDFQIEGLNIGESLLNYMSLKEINSSKRNYTKNKQYYVVGYDKDLKTYDQVDVYLKSNDKKYIIKTLGGVLFMDVDQCLVKKKEVIADLREIFSNATEKTYHDVPHIYDKTGNSIQHQTGFLLKNDNDDDHIRVECMDWSKKYEDKNNWQDNFNVGVFSKEILTWFKLGYK